MHGLQLWVARPTAHEESAPSFHHHASATLPERDRSGVRLRVLAGAAYDLMSPVETRSPLFYVDAILSPGGELTLPQEHEERAAHVVSGGIGCGTERAEVGRMSVLAKGAHVVLRAEQPARVVLIGGAPLDGRRFIDWNFVSSSKERLERAKRDRKEGRFPKVPGDEIEFVPLPDRSP